MQQQIDRPSMLIHMESRSIFQTNQPPEIRKSKQWQASNETKQRRTGLVSKNCLRQCFATNDGCEAKEYSGCSHEFAKRSEGKKKASESGG